jgi:hypothetical protein
MTRCGLPRFTTARVSHSWHDDEPLPENDPCTANCLVAGRRLPSAADPWPPHPRFDRARDRPPADRHLCVVVADPNPDRHRCDSCWNGNGRRDAQEDLKRIGQRLWNLDDATPGVLQADRCRMQPTCSGPDFIRRQTPGHSHNAGNRQPKRAARRPLTALATLATLATLAAADDPYILTASGSASRPSSTARVRRAPTRCNRSSALS